MASFLHLTYDHDMDEYLWQYWADNDPIETVGGSHKILEVTDGQRKELMDLLSKAQEAQKVYKTALSILMENPLREVK